MLELELAAPLPDIEPVAAPDGSPYESGLALVCLHGVPVAIAELERPGGRLDAAGCAAAVWSAAGPAANEHLVEDGLEPAAGLGPDGLAHAPGEPRCSATRNHFLADAPELTVIIPSRERPERLARCLDSIIASEYPRDRYEIVVVDNAPETDRTRVMVESYAGRDPLVRYVREDRSGSASARNAGLDVVDNEIVVFTDDDVIAGRHWLTEIARAFVSGPEIGCVSGLLVPAELDTPAQIWFEQYGGFSRGFDRKVYDLHGNRLASPLYPYSAGVFGTGNNMAFRRSVLERIGRFDPALGNGTPALGGVDSEVLLRTVLCGHTIVYEPRAFVHHAHRRDYEALRRQIYNYGAGLSAYLLKTLLANPRLVPDFARRVPRGLAFALDPRSEKNENKRGDYPSELTRQELAGMLYGPIAYARSRRRFGSHRVPSVDATAVAGRG
jgi:cellulose synthase/poly-beta-1,6-N-acetylglucosamine synthase-like glycosyltransferase